VAKLAVTFLSDTIAGLESAVNVFLATKVAGSSIIVLGLSIVLNDLDRYKGTQYSAILSYDDTGAAAQATPYVLDIIDQANATDLDAAWAAWYVAHAADFTTGIRNITFGNNPSRLPRLTAWGVYSTTAVAAGTNWALV
jgi:hypothetical protein